MKLLNDNLLIVLAVALSNVITWMAKGYIDKDSVNVKQAKAVLEMWETTAKAQEKEIAELKNQLGELNKKMIEMQKHINKLEIENQRLKKNTD